MNPTEDRLIDAIDRRWGNRDEWDLSVLATLFPRRPVRIVRGIRVGVVRRIDGD